ncbi:unnamed protein product [Adineta steineri]|uniref:Uncharacterized protein n=1 Tax=Adineta steineri TaxID=433720 RepID=A0A814PXK4_9BILA|nr:unnamed protein product [Adineta steineri]CAF1111699.1 unnamed protein product [Adineta steineri]
MLRGPNQNQLSSDDENIPETKIQRRVRMLEFYATVKDTELKEIINSQNCCSTIDVSCQKLDDSNMATVIKYGINEKKCKSLNLWGNRFTYKSITILANVLGGNTTLRELDLSHNLLTDQGVEIISHFLSLNTCAIKDLDLSGNDITDNGAQYLANMLTKNQTLKFLSLNKNQITDYGLSLLVKAVKNNNNKLTVLKLESNPDITPNGVEHAINELKENKILQDIYFKHCKLDDSDKKNFEENAALKTGFYVII